MPFPIEHWVVLSSITLLAAILRGALGMGFALMVIPAFILLEPTLVPGSIIGIGLILSILVVAREWKAIDTRGLKISVPGRMLGNAVAVLLFGWIATEWFDLLTGIAVLIAVVLSLLPVTFHPSGLRLFTAGLFSGIMGTMSSLDGPPIAILYQHQKGPVIRATLGGYFVIGAIGSLIALALAGRLGVHQLLGVLWLTPAALLGFWSSGWVARILPKSIMRKGILAVSGIAALLLIYRGVS
jgi:uncharacterized membrane protein YfcA